VNDALRDELIALADEDQRVRAELAADGSLYRGYNPAMEAVHLRNSARLEEIIDTHGWPGRALVGEEGSRAAWLILQHAISRPQFQRRGLALLQAAEASGDVPLVEVAMLEDRIRVFEGKPQVYGTQFDWDENGMMSPLPIDDVEHVNKRRAAIGLNSIEERTEQARAGSAASGEPVPPDYTARKREMDEWARSAGWHD
jgi:hypothetical protein